MDFFFLQTITVHTRTWILTQEHWLLLVVHQQLHPKSQSMYAFNLINNNHVHRRNLIEVDWSVRHHDACRPAESDGEVHPVQNDPGRENLPIYDRKIFLILKVWHFTLDDLSKYGHITFKFVGRYFYWVYNIFQ